jgi:hypothetical protein
MPFDDGSEVTMRRFNQQCRQSGAGIRAIPIAVVLVFGIGNGGKAAVSAPLRAPVAAASAADRWSYADVADLFLATPVVANARIIEAIPVTEATNTPPRSGTIRYYLIADVVTLIRGTGGLAPRVSWIADVPLDARGRPPKLKKLQVLLAALPVTGRPAELRLAARDGMVPWSVALEARVRSVIASGLAADAAPRVTGITSAFHSPGNLPGEGETQIFLTTASSQPVSINVLRRPGQATSWAVSLGEIVDEAARAPARDTLGWYRLACFLPPSLPGAAVADLSESDAAAARGDYGFVIEALGPCTRTRS